MCDNLFYGMPAQNFPKYINVKIHVNLVPRLFPLVSCGGKPWLGSGAGHVSHKKLIAGKGMREKYHSTCFHFRTLHFDCKE